jgi:hypothetical protein
MIVETTGNLLLDDAQALVNTVNTVGSWAKGSPSSSRGPSRPTSTHRLRQRRPRLGHRTITDLREARRLDAEIRLYGLGTPSPEDMPVRSPRPA